ncbi:ErpA-related iron-sulfur cluster insertion protein [Desulfovibrio sp. Fe33]|uniref:ErpA-related iron-sulfur cluster insertion protein n=1 Tax=Desulfovibrio sp. Fe33 TaxID=3020842 RepID=UPI00234C9E35|nr:ErpA-related iron-sulfur cluster insertion protein [Desulfovibrio sp. Fe33]
MFEVTVPEEMLEKLRDMLDDEESCVRLREYKTGGGCHSKIVLGLGIDELDEDEDERVQVEDVPFIAEKDFLLKHGRKYTLSFSDKKEVVLTPAGE